MFTGIIEGLGKVVDIQREGGNVHFQMTCPFTQELNVDQSVAHNGVCLTVTKLDGVYYWVTAIQETLDKTTLKNWQVGQNINLERAMLSNARLDGHFVQGHVDTTAICTSILDERGSFRLTFQYDSNPAWLTIEKGSITVDGISLTVVNSGTNTFDVCIIPYTWENTQLNQLKVGDEVNLEFDVFGKYVLKYTAAYQRILAAQS